MIFINNWFLVFFSVFIFSFFIVSPSHHNDMFSQWKRQKRKYWKKNSPSSSWGITIPSSLFLVLHECGAVAVICCVLHRIEVCKERNASLSEWIASSLTLSPTFLTNYTELCFFNARQSARLISRAWEKRVKLYSPQLNSIHHQKHISTEFGCTERSNWNIYSMLVQQSKWKVRFLKTLPS